MKPSDIDLVARTRLAELARQLATGHITNDQFEGRLPQSRETALQEIFYCGLWPLYSDFREYRLVKKHRLTPEDLAWVSRIVLFLRSGFPYRWPSTTSPVPVALLSLATLGWYGRRWRKNLAPDGDKAVWPFFSQSEYEQALASPVYLRGHDVVQPTP